MSALASTATLAPEFRTSAAPYYRAGLRELMPTAPAAAREAGMRMALTKAGVDDYSEFAAQDAATLAQHNVPVGAVDHLVALRKGMK
jgi:hypothetical protein